MLILIFIYAWETEKYWIRQSYMVRNVRIVTRWQSELVSDAGEKLGDGLASLVTSQTMACWYPAYILYFENSDMFQYTILLLVRDNSSLFNDNKKCITRDQGMVCGKCVVGSSKTMSWEMSRRGEMDKTIWRICRCCLPSNCHSNNS